MSHTKFLGLDALRGIAALFVLLRHTSGYWGPFPFHHSYLAVDLFFVLSGFVIAHAYERRFEEGTMTPSRFVAVRLIRLYPMYFLGLAIGLIWAVSKMARGMQVFSIGDGQLPRVLLLSLAFLPAHVDPALFLFPLNGPSWSLFYELIVNIAYSFTRRFLSSPVLLALLGTSAVVISLVSYKAGSLDLGITAGPKVILGAGTRALFGMGYGLAIYRGYARGIRLPAGLASSTGPMVLLAIVFLAPAFGRFNWLVDVLAVTLVLPVCVLWSASSPTPVRLRGFYIFLGATSYPLYALHWPLSELGSLLFSDAISRHHPLSGLLFTAVLLALCATVVRSADESVRARLTVRFLPPVPRGAAVGGSR